MRVKVQKWGDSLALRIPKPFAQGMGVREGTAVQLSVGLAHAPRGVRRSASGGPGAGSTGQARRPFVGKRAAPCD